MRHSRRFVCALAGLALAISTLLFELGSNREPGAFKAGRSPVAAAMVGSRPADPERPNSAPGPRPQRAQSEISTAGWAPEEAPRFAGELGRKADERLDAESLDEEASTQRVAARDAVSPIELDVPELAPGALSFRATGFDPDAPRDLTLWRTGDEGWARLAETTSGGEGNFDFGSVLIPVHGIALVATAKGMPPTLEAVRDPLLVRSELPLPRIGWLESEGASFSFEVQTSIAEGSVLLAGADEKLIARFEVSAGSTSPSARLAIDLETDDDVVLIAHELPDGRSSRWRILRLDTGESDLEGL